MCVVCFDRLSKDGFFTKKELSDRWVFGANVDDSNYHKYNIIIRKNYYGNLSSKRFCNTIIIRRSGINVNSYLDFDMNEFKKIKSDNLINIFIDFLKTSEVYYRRYSLINDLLDQQHSGQSALPEP